MNKLTLPRWWEASLLLLPIAGTIVTLLILLFLPIGVIIVMNKGKSFRIVRNWPLIQGMLLLAPLLSTIGLVGSHYLLHTPPIGSSILVPFAALWMASYLTVGLVYNKAMVEVGELKALLRATRATSR